MAEVIAEHVGILREGDDAAKTAAARALGNLAWAQPGTGPNQVLIAEAGAIAPLVELLRDGSAWAQSEAARALGLLALHNNANNVLIAAAGAIPPIVGLFLDWSASAGSATTMAALIISAAWLLPCTCRQVRLRHGINHSMCPASRSFF